MNNINEMENSKDCQSVLLYLNNVLIYEFPNKEITPSHMLLSILDFHECEAYAMIAYTKNASVIDDMQSYFINECYPTSNVMINDNNVGYGDEMLSIMYKADFEAEELSDSTVNTGHILLSMLNPKNSFGIMETLNGFGIDYDTMKSNYKTMKIGNGKKKVNNKNNDMNDCNNILKSDVNSMAMVTGESTPFIEKYTVNLHKEIENGKYDKLIGRDDIINNVIKVLSRRKKNNVILVGKPGTGKCLAKGTKVLMYDGTFRKVEEISVGDRLMGVDSTPREVLDLGSGTDNMYRIHQKNGKDYTVNSRHILSLLKDGEVRNISIKEYMSYSSEEKNGFYGYRAGLIRFDGNEEVTVDPYELGRWFGEPFSSKISKDYIFDNLLGITVKLPEEYKKCSVENRLKLLNGIMDGFCSRYKDGKHIFYVHSHDLYADLNFICNSLGLSFTSKPVSGTSLYKFEVSGKLLEDWLEKHSVDYGTLDYGPVSNGNISVEPIGDGEYYGFEIDGDKLFMLEDFTVTHNTSIGYRLAEMIDNGDVPENLEGKKVVMLNAMSLLSGAQLRGMMEERVDGLFSELKASKNYILFIDDMQSIIKNSNKDKDGDISDVIAKILSGGDVRVIGTISFKDYRNGIENNPVLSTKLQKILVEPSTKEETIEILKENKGYYEKYHHVKFSEACIEKAVNLAKRYITNNCLPDSAIDVIDLTGASVRLKNGNPNVMKSLTAKLKGFDDEKKSAMKVGDFEKLDEIAKKESGIIKEISDIRKTEDRDENTWINVTEDDIADTVSSMTMIPVSKLSDSNKKTILHIDEILKRDVIGQDEAINEISKAIKRSRAGFSDNNKCTSLMMLGSTGCGKCVTANTKIRIRNKKTGKILTLTMRELKSIAKLKR